MEEISWLDKHSEASMVLFDVAQEIRDLAKAFKITGNFSMCKTLIFIAADIDNKTKDMSDAIGESLQESIKRSGDSSKAILEAALAGLKLAKKS